MICKKCNSENEATSKFCENCGANLRVVKNPVQVSKSLDRLIIGCLILLYVLAVVLTCEIYNYQKLRAKNIELGNTIIPRMESLAGYNYRTGDIDVIKVRNNSNYWYDKLQIPLEERNEQIINEVFLNKIKYQIELAHQELDYTSKAKEPIGLEFLVFGLMLCELIVVLFLLISRKLELSFGITSILLIIWSFIGLIITNYIELIFINLLLVFFVAALIVLVNKYAFAKNQKLL